MSEKYNFILIKIANKIKAGEVRKIARGNRDTKRNAGT